MRKANAPLCDRSMSRNASQGLRSKVLVTGHRNADGMVR